MKHDSYYARLKSILAKPKRGGGGAILVSRRVLEGLADEMEAAAREINRFLKLDRLVPPPPPDVWIARHARPAGGLYQLQFGQAMYRTKGEALAAGPFAVRLKGIDPEAFGWRAPEYHPRTGTRLVGEVAEVAELSVSGPMPTYKELEHLGYDPEFLGPAQAGVVDIGAGMDPEKE